MKNYMQLPLLYQKNTHDILFTQILDSLIIYPMSPVLMKKKICVIGASGLLGYKIISRYTDYEIFGTYNQTPVNHHDISLIQLDITKSEDCEKIIEFKPDFIINTAGITNVDYCEKYKEESYLVNVIGTRNIVKIANKLNCKLVHISTDGIFSGKNLNYTENDLPDPINQYGKTKLESENEVRLLNDYLILRTNVLYGYVSNNLIKSRSNYLKPLNFGLWVLSELYQNKNIKIVNDQFSNPTLADNLARIIIDCIKANLVGTFHSTDLTCISRLEFSKKLAEKFGFSEKLITEISLKDLGLLAPRPLKTCLDCSKIIKNGIKLSSLDNALDIMYNQIQKENPSMNFLV